MLETAVQFITALFWFIIVLGLLIFIHEFGHFIVAKMCGVKVLKFSLGFGKKLLGFTRGETEYIVSALPLGGYVKMLGEEDFAEAFESADGKGRQLSKEDIPPEEYERSFTAKSVFRRLMIVGAGPVLNILLALVLIYGLFLSGMPSSLVEISDVVSGSPSDRAGFKAGDQLVEMDGEELMMWEQMQHRFDNISGSDRVTLTFLRGGKEYEKEVPVKGGPGVDGAGFRAAVIVGPANTKKPAYLSGIRSGDRITEIDGVTLESWPHMYKIISSSPGKELSIAVKRDGVRHVFRVAPEKVPVGDGEFIGLIGIQRGAVTIQRKYGAIESIGLTGSLSVRVVLMTGEFVVGLFSGKQDIAGVAGPIGIAKMSAEKAEKGLHDLVWLIAVLSITLGVINLVPIPVLDGGAIFFLLLEGLMGRPLDMKKREFIQMVGFIIIVTLMIIVVGSDILKHFGYLPTYR